MPLTSASPNAIEIFFCYASKDEALQAELETHLSIFKRQGLIRGWNKRKINGGGEWTHEISGYVNTAQIILLLVSRDFMVSDYCTGIEMKRALERNETGEARVIPIILRPVDWKSTPFGKLPVLPTNGIPIKRWQDSDEAFLNVARGIRDIIKDFTNKSLMGSTYDSGTALLDSITEPVAPIVWNAPSPLHPFFTDRDEALDELYTTLTRGTQLPVAIIGPEGIGKTQLALKYAYHYNKDY